MNRTIKDCMRVLVSGGGTGGHIYPALAVAARLRDEYQAEILFLGSDDGLETQLVPAAGFKLATIKAGKLRRYVSWQTVKGVMRVPLGMLQAVDLVRRFHADAAFTSGGYVAVPAGLAAFFNHVPLLMHQQDVPPNLSNRQVAPFATRISVAFADSLSYFPAQKTVLLGNPVRQQLLDILNVPIPEARTRLALDPTQPVLLVTGGSQGARHLNQVVCQALPTLLADTQVLQISGQTLYQETRDQSNSILASFDETLRSRYHLVPYLEAEMATAVQAADLVLCRSGASTLSELAALGKPGLLIPLPPAIGRSPQEANAAMFTRRRAGEMLKDADLEPDLLAARVHQLLASPAELASMGQAARALSRPTATQDIAAAVTQIARIHKVLP
jgi:UDP-N-acetylglucosamine--N-acetylmuramyl-(pentapeptide) pyrophosphoryl-undecaprenol N-acetylglucosamine transferase